MPCCNPHLAPQLYEELGLPQPQNPLPTRRGCLVPAQLWTPRSNLHLLNT